MAAPLSRLLFALCSSGVVAQRSQPDQAPLERASAGSGRAAGAGEEGEPLAGSASSCAGELIGALHAAAEPEQDARRGPGHAAAAAGSVRRPAVGGPGARSEPEREGRGEPDQAPRALEAAVSLERRHLPASPEAVLPRCAMPVQALCALEARVSAEPQQVPKQAPPSPEAALPPAAARMDGAIQQGIRLWSPKKGGPARAGSDAGSTPRGQHEFETDWDEAGGITGGASTLQPDDAAGNEADTVRLETCPAQAASLPQVAAGEKGIADGGPAGEGDCLDHGSGVALPPAPLDVDRVDIADVDGHAPAPLAEGGAERAHAAPTRSDGGTEAPVCEVLCEEGRPGQGQQKRGWRVKMGRAASRVPAALKPKALPVPLKPDRINTQSLAAVCVAASASAVAGALTEPAAAEHDVGSRASSASGDAPSIAQAVALAPAAPALQTPLQPCQPARSSNGSAEEPFGDSSGVAVSQLDGQGRKRGNLLKGKLAKLAWKPGLKGQGAPPKSSLASSDAGAWPELEEVPILSCPYLYVACQCSEACFGGLAGLPSCMTMLAKCSCC